MKLDEAIKTAEYSFTDPWAAPKGKLGDAIKLLIEAGKFTKSSRDPHGIPPYTLLPGETLE